MVTLRFFPAERPKKATILKNTLFMVRNMATPNYYQRMRQLVKANSPFYMHGAAILYNLQAQSQNPSISNILGFKLFIQFHRSFDWVNSTRLARPL